jgi:hypothetical protein
MSGSIPLLQVTSCTIAVDRAVVGNRVSPELEVVFQGR